MNEALTQTKPNIYPSNYSQTHTNLMNYNLNQQYLYYVTKRNQLNYTQPNYTQTDTKPIIHPVNSNFNQQYQYDVGEKKYQN